MRKVMMVVPVVIGALGAVSVNFKDHIKRIGVNVRLEGIQKTTLLGTAEILGEYCPCKKKEKRDLGSVVTCYNPSKGL